jgi:predicted DNA-binding transcriptional regulator AlpA
MAKRLKDEKYLSITDVCERYSVTRWTVRRWINSDSTFPQCVEIKNRKYFSEYDLAKWEASRGGRDPDVDGKMIGLEPVSGVITEYDQLVTALVKRRETLGISSMELDARSGMQEGYVSKLENYGRPQGRGMGPETFPLWLGGLKCGIILVDLPRRPRKKG